MPSAVTGPMIFPNSHSRPSPELVYEAILFHLGSWENALVHPDGQAVIRFYLPSHWQPPGPDPEIDLDESM